MPANDLGQGEEGHPLLPVWEKNHRGFPVRKGAGRPWPDGVLKRKDGRKTRGGLKPGYGRRSAVGQENKNRKGKTKNDRMGGEENKKNWYAPIDIDDPV